jgi:hypothetical protein
MLGGFKYYDALDRILDDREIHGFFRQPQLIKMLVSMMYWRRLDSTPWSKYVPETFYEMADERLDGLLARGGVPPPWEAPDEHIAYPDEDVDSTVDDTNADPDFKPLEHAVSGGSASSSSGEDSEEAEFADPASVKSTSKRGRSSSDSDAPLVVAVNAKRQKSGSGSARQGSGRQGTGHSQTPSKSSTSRRRKSALAAVEYSKLTIPELQMIEIPDDGDLSWMYCGIKVVRGNGRKAQTPGFPDYEPHKHSSQQVKARWNVEEYLVLLETKPWEAMSEDRIRVLYFHRRSELSSAALRMLERIVDAMLKYAQEVW